MKYTQSQAKRMHEALERLVTEESEMVASYEAWSAADALLAELEKGE